MIRVLVVEDEPPIQRSVVRCIERRPEEFMVAATAINGRQALGFLESEPVDAVFTDIRMPVMDGLALAKEIRTRFPDIEVVIISGYQDFAFMREALVSQVSDYLLKPVTPAAMDPVLDKLRAKISALRERRRRDTFERAIRSADWAPEEAASADAAAGRYGVYLICAGPYPLVGDAMLPARAFWNEITLEQEAAALLEYGETAMCFAGKTAAEMVALAEIKSAERADAFGRALWKRLNDQAPLPVTVGCSAGLLPLSGIGNALQSIRSRLHTGTRLFSAQFLRPDGEGNPRETDGQFAKPFERQLREALQSKDRPALEKGMLGCVESFVRMNTTEIQLVHFLENVLNAHSNLFAAQTTNLKLELRGAVSNAVGAEPLARDLAYLFSGLFEDVEEEGEGRSEPPIVAQIELFLQENFDKSVTNTVLSEHFGFVPSYISRLFRTYRGVVPSEHLTRYRIQRAAELMEREPDLLFKEVASRVGFNDQYYFSKIFKKETGMWPSEYIKSK